MRDGLVEVSGSGWPPGVSFILSLCPAGIEIGEIDRGVRCDRTFGEGFRGDETGEFAITLDMSPAIGVGLAGRREVNCLDTPCVVAATDVSDLVIAHSEPVEWEERQLPSAPHVVVRDLEFDDMANTGRAEVEGSRFAPGSRVALVQCPGAGDGSVDAEDCLYGYGAVVSVDLDGTFRVEMDLYPKFQRSSGEIVDCVTTPELCLVSDPWPKDRWNRYFAVPLSD